MRLSGLMSGMDTESIVAQLVEAKKTKVTKAVKAQKSLKYKQDAWKDLNKKILNLYNKSISNMRFESAYIKKTTKVSNSSVVSVITGEKAMNGVQSLNVDKLAKQAFLTGGELPATVRVKRKGEDGVEREVVEDVTGKTTLGDLGFEGTGSIKVVTADKTTELKIDANSTLDALVTSLQKAGLSANYDEANRRFYVTSKASGVENDFSIIANDAKGLDALSKLGLSYDSQEVRDSYAKIFGAQEKLDKSDAAFQSMYASLSNEDKAVFDSYNPDSGKKLEYTKLSDEGKKAYYAYISSDAVKAKTIQARQDAKLNSLTKNLEDLEKKKAELETENARLAQDFQGDGAAVMQALQDALTKDNLNISIADGLAGKLIGSDKETFETYLNEAFKTAKENASEDVVKKLEMLQSSWKTNVSSLTSNAASIESVKKNLKKAADGVTWELADDVAQSIKDEVDTAVALYNSLGTAATAEGKVAGENAEIHLNGVRYTSSKNTFDINGLTLTVSATTAKNEVVTITTEDDTNGIYDMIKGFIKEYSTLINEMDKLYNADSAKGYDPLTDEEKEAMSDSQIEEWENKIKDSILRKDGTLGNFGNELKRIMMEGVEVNGKKMYLSNFGIGTLSYFSAPENEKNAYHIDGDPDDESTSGNPDKLKAMIANDPDTVVSFFTKLSQNLYSKMFDMMKAEEGISSSMTAYEDKKMQSDYDDYTAKIKELEKKLADYEDKWYAKFAAMETALAKMQNNASAVTSLLGG